MSIDSDLAALVKRRDQARDLLVRAYTEIVDCDDRIDGLLAERVDTVEPERMT